MLKADDVKRCSWQGFAEQVSEKRVVRTSDAIKRAGLVDPRQEGGEGGGRWRELQDDEAGEIG